MAFLKAAWRYLRLGAAQANDSGSGRMMAFQRMYGQFFVIYPDQKKSQILGFSTACDYASIFGGTVHHITLGEVTKRDRTAKPLVLLLGWGLFLGFLIGGGSLFLDYAIKASSATGQV